MSAIVRTPECFPENDRFLNTMGLSDPPQARHEACSGGFSMPGMLGGWHCPCECHRDSASSPSDQPSRAVGRGADLFRERIA